MNKLFKKFNDEILNVKIGALWTLMQKWSDQFIYQEGEIYQQQMLLPENINIFETSTNLIFYILYQTNLRIFRGIKLTLEVFVMTGTFWQMNEVKQFRFGSFWRSLSSNFAVYKCNVMCERFQA